MVGEACDTINIINEWPSKSLQRARKHNANTLKLKQLNGIQPSLI